MKYLLLFSLLFIALPSQASAEMPRDTVAVFTVGAGGAPLRDQPSIRGGVIAEVPGGTRLAALEQSGRYWRVIYGEVEGWISEAFITGKIVPGEPGFARPVANATSSIRFPQRRSFFITLDLGYMASSSEGNGNSVLVGGGSFGWRYGWIGGNVMMGAGNAAWEEERNVPGTSALPGYYWDYSVDRCRNRSNGQFAPSSYCGTSSYTTYDFYQEAVYVLAADIGLTVPIAFTPSHISTLLLGGGLRTGSATAPYASASIAIPFTPNVRSSISMFAWAKATVGSGGYRQGNVGFGFTW